MNPEQLANKNILTQPVYEPGKPIEEVARELGLNISDIAKLASNENPLGCSPKAKEAIKSSADNSHLYPDGSCYYLTEAVAEFRELNTNHAVIGYYTAKSWRLPRIWCDVIAEHHNATR